MKLTLSEYPKTRLTIYIVGITAQIASFFVTIYSPELADAFSKTADALGAIALGTAALNLDQSSVLSPYDTYLPDE